MKMKHFILLASSTVLMLLSTTITSCSKGNSGPDIENAEAIISSIANWESYDWITAEEVQTLKPCDLRDSFKMDVEFKDFIEYAVDDWRTKGERVGINWDDVKVDSVVITNDAKASEALGCNVSQGYFLLASGGKKFKINYEQAIRLDSVGPWKTIMFTTFAPLDKNAKIPTTAEMKQNGHEESERILMSLDERVSDFKEILMANITNQSGSLALDNINLYEDEIISFVFQDPAVALEYFKMIQDFLAKNKELITNNIGDDPKVMAKIQNMLSSDPAEYVKAIAKNKKIKVDDEEFNNLKVESKYRIWRNDF